MVQPSKKPKRSKRGRLLLFVGIGILAVAGAAYWYFYIRTTAPIDENQLTVEEQRMSDLNNAAAVDGNIDETDRLLNESLSAASTDEEKVSILLQTSAGIVANEAASDNAKQKALLYAKQAYELSPGAASAWAVHYAAKATGDKKLADEYFTIADKLATEEAKNDAKRRE